MKKSIILLLGATLLFQACNQNNGTIPDKEVIALEEDEFEKIKVEVKVKHLEDEMFNFKSKKEVSDFLKKYPEFVEVYLQVPNAATEAPFIDQVYEMYSNPKLQEFYQENKKFYGDFSDVNKELNSLFSYIKYYYPEHYVPEVNTLITGFRYDRDFALSDSLIVIAIDYFVGPTATYRPQFYDYMLVRYQKPYICPMLGLAISEKYNVFDAKDETMLAEMIHYGKAHYFLERVIPELADSLNIQFSGQELKETNENVDVIWSHFIENKLLFETNHKTKQRYVGESPKVVAIGDNCPGRIGRWLGWQIVRKYMKENPEVSLQDLMKNSSAGEIFKKSKFKVKLN